LRQQGFKMKDNNSPQTPIQLSNQEGSGLIDIRQMAETLKASGKEKQKRSLIDMSLPSSPAAPLGGALLLPLPKQRSPLALVGIIMGGTTLATAVILGTLFATGVFAKKSPEQPMQIQAAAAQQPVAPPVAPSPVVEAQPTPVVASEPKKTGKQNTKKTVAAPTKTGAPTIEPPKPPPTKKNAHKDELDELLGGK
jgi:outer membrane biosynthesis protein TonB